MIATFKAAAIELAEFHEENSTGSTFSFEILAGGSVRVVGGENRAEDQREYCAALFEAAVGHAPAGAARWPNTLPAWLGHIALRGLSPAASEQWPSMRAIVDAFVEGMRKPPRRWPWLVAILGLAGALVSAMPDSTCARTLPEVGHRGLDDWASAWTIEHETACRQERDRTTSCLDRIRHRHRVLTEALDDPYLQSAVDALPPPHACADPVLVASEPERPTDPRAANTWTTIEADIERARASANLNRVDAALALANAALERARSLQEPILLGRALWTVGNLEARSGRLQDGLATMERAYATLDQADQARAAGKVALSIASTLAQTQAGPAEVHRWASRAEAAFEARGATSYERETLERVLRSSSR